MSTVTVMLVGRSGCGKGTQAKLLKEYLERTTGREVVYVSTGDKMREAMKLGNATARLIEEKIMKAGNLAPHALAVWAWFDTFIQQGLSNDKHLIFDGTPRTKEEAVMMVDVLEWYGRKAVYPILLQATAEEVTRRMLARGRADDSPENIRNRLAFYEHQVLPAFGVLGYRYGFQSATAGDDDPETIHRKILTLLDQ